MSNKIQVEIEDLVSLFVELHNFFHGLNGIKASDLYSIDLIETSIQNKITKFKIDINKMIKKGSNIDIDLPFLPFPFMLNKNELVKEYVKKLTFGKK